MKPFLFDGGHVFALDLKAGETLVMKVGMSAGGLRGRQ